jgi:hypothetical protein
MATPSSRSLLVGKERPSIGTSANARAKPLGLCMKAGVPVAARTVRPLTANKRYQNPAIER